MLEHFLRDDVGFLKIKMRGRERRIDGCVVSVTMNVCLLQH